MRVCLIVPIALFFWGCTPDDHSASQDDMEKTTKAKMTAGDAGTNEPKPEVSGELPVQTPRPSLKQAAMGEPDLTRSDGDWIYHQYRTNKGTRSEGRHGELLYKGKPIHAASGTVKATPLGTFIYEGSLSEKANLWDSSGWMPRSAAAQSEETHTRERSRSGNVEGMTQKNEFSR